MAVGGSTHRVPTASLTGAFARMRQEARAVTSGEYLMSVPVEMQARDWRLETEPEAAPKSRSPKETAETLFEESVSARAVGVLRSAILDFVYTTM